MKIQKAIVVIFSTTLFISLGVYSYNFWDNKKEKTPSDSNNTNISMNENSDQAHTSIDKDQNTVEKKKYYVVEVVYNTGGSSSSFVPLKLNPGYKYDSDFHMNISRDDNGNLINGDKIIEINNFVISDKNKENIKNIAGSKNYEEALKEIEDKVETLKNDAIKKGHFKE
ncbi:hypothetical protein [Clostridium hydrogeniformans]|uniref:hypothetical protein n=1 Tax=Clostridium hydrogeniformans TaxID=349933 RepID=UPI000489966C|nr:hypothetical protein [Clostridium hydrogeniformans]